MKVGRRRDRSYLSLMISPPASARSEALVSQARELMNEHQADPSFGLVTASAALFVSSRHLQRAFAACGSRGFCFELARMRSHLAAAILRENPRKSVAAVTVAVGYRHPPHFAKVFRTHVGIAPGQWRRECRALA